MRARIDAGVESTGLDQRHPNPERRNLVRQRLAQALDSRSWMRCTSRARGTPRCPRSKRSARCAGALLAQERERRLGDPESAEEVRVQLIAGLLLGQLLDHPVLAVTRVVDDHVEPPEVIVRALHRREARRAVGHVELQREERVAVRSRELVERPNVARRARHAVSALERRRRPRASKPAVTRGPCDEPRLARHAAHCMGRALRGSEPCSEQDPSRSVRERAARVAREPRGCPRRYDLIPPGTG